MKLTSKELIEEFYELHVREKYPDLSFERCRDICQAPWLYLKQEIGSGKLHSVRLKYFGTFVVYPKRVLLLFQKFRKKFAVQRMSLKNFEKKRSIILKYLRENEDTV